MKKKFLSLARIGYPVFVNKTSMDCYESLNSFAPAAEIRGWPGFAAKTLSNFYQKLGKKLEFIRIYGTFIVRAQKSEGQFIQNFILRFSS